MLALNLLLFYTSIFALIGSKNGYLELEISDSSSIMGYWSLVRDSVSVSVENSDQ